MTRLESIGYEVVDLMPKALDQGILYVSIEYAVAVHLCCCGCGNRVVTPLNPAQWNVTFDGETVSLSPSVGSHDLACASHYWIRRGRVRWACQWDKDEVAAGRRADRLALDRHYDESVAEKDDDSDEVVALAPLTKRRGRFLGWL
jgi:hypothetical protein